MGLAFTRREGESFWINGNVRVTVQTISNTVRLHVEAPREVKILREELIEGDLPLIDGHRVKNHRRHYRG